MSLKYKFINKVCAAAAMCALVSSCTAALIGGGGVAAIVGGKIASQEKTVGSSFSDTTIWTKIRTGLANKGIDNILLGTINIEVHEGRVLLTGTVPDKDKIITILRVCWNVNGVREVINELRIAESKAGAIDTLKDSWITTKVKTKLLASKIVKSANYSVESLDGIVYLFGTAQSQEELDKAIDLISNTADVKKVVSYVKVNKNIDSRLKETKGVKLEDEEKEEFAPEPLYQDDANQPEIKSLAKREAKPINSVDTAKGSLAEENDEVGQLLSQSKDASKPTTKSVIKETKPKSSKSDIFEKDDY